LWSPNHEHIFESKGTTGGLGNLRSLHIGWTGSGYVIVMVKVKIPLVSVCLIILW